MSAHRILLVEDSPEVQIVVCAALKRKFLVQTVATFKDAMQKLENDAFSLIILDVELPDGDGFAICAQLKMHERHRNTPVIFLSGKAQITDKVMGLSLGADDYIVKPVEPLEFQARVEARIRNIELAREARENVCIGDFRVIPTQQKIFISSGAEERALELTTMEFKLLFLLLRSENQIFSREQILNEVWGPLANVTDRTVDTHIYTIRKKIGATATCIQAISRAGYRYAQSETSTSKIPSAQVA